MRKWTFQILGQTSDRPIVIRHRRREMRNAPMDIPDPRLD